MRRMTFALFVLIAIVFVLVGGGSPYAAEAPREKTLRLSYIEDILTLDPPRITKMADYPLAMNIFNGLVRYKSNSVEIEPDLATRWEVSKDGLTYTFWLRQGVKFHKGYGDFTAQDVKFSLERVLDPRIRSPYAGDMQVLKDVEIVNDYTVRLHLKEPYADFLTAVLAFRPGYIVSRKAAEEFGDRFGVNPIGTGPYMFERYTPRQEIVLVVNPDYFGWYRSGGRKVGGGPRISRIVFRVIPEETVAILAMSKGELDYTTVRTPEGYKLITRDPNLGYTSTPVLGRTSMWANTRRAPLNSIALRRALSHAINRKEFIETVAEGAGTEEGLWTEIPPGVFGHVSDVPSFPYDLDRARAVLQESGYRRDSRALSIVTRPGDKFFAETIQGYWAKLGVNTRVEVLDAAALRSRYNAGDWDFFVSNPSRAAPDQFLVRYLSTADPNFYGRVDNLIYAQRREVDVEKRKTLLRQLQIRLASEIPVIPVYRPYYVTGFRKGVTGDVPNTFFWLWYWELMDIPN